MLLQYPGVLWGEQVWVEERGPSRPTCMHSHIHGENELMKWQCSGISGRPNAGATNEPLEGRDGGEALGEAG